MLLQRKLPGEVNSVVDRVVVVVGDQKRRHFADRGSPFSAKGHVQPADRQRVVDVDHARIVQVTAPALDCAPDHVLVLACVGKF